MHFLTTNKPNPEMYMPGPGQKDTTHTVLVMLGSETTGMLEPRRM